MEEMCEIKDKKRRRKKLLWKKKQVDINGRFQTLNHLRVISLNKDLILLPNLANI